MRSATQTSPSLTLRVHLRVRKQQSVIGTRSIGERSLRWNSCVFRGACNERFRCDPFDRQDRAGLLVVTLHFGNTARIASYVAEGDGSNDGQDAASDFVGATGKKCPCGALGNRWETRRRDRVLVDN